MPFGNGERGLGVSDLQNKLNMWIEHHKKTATDTGLIHVNADGVFGHNTVVALARYQKCNGLGSSGFADSDTLAGLGLERTLEADGSVLVIGEDGSRISLLGGS